MACDRTYNWTGYKTGIGKSQAQLLEMSKHNHTCKYCGSKELVTGLAWDEPAMEMSQRYNADFCILTSYEIAHHQKNFLHLDTSVYECRHCGFRPSKDTSDFVMEFCVISKWTDSDGTFLLLYCPECDKRFATTEHLDGDGEPREKKPLKEETQSIPSASTPEPDQLKFIEELLPYISESQQQEIAISIFTKKLEHRLDEIISARYGTQEGTVFNPAGKAADHVIATVVDKYTSKLLPQLGPRIFDLARLEIERTEPFSSDPDQQVSHGTVMASVSYSLQDLARELINQRRAELEPLIWEKVLASCDEMMLQVFCGEIIKSLNLNEAIKKLLETKALGYQTSTKYAEPMVFQCPKCSTKFTVEYFGKPFPMRPNYVDGQLDRTPLVGRCPYCNKTVQVKDDLTPTWD
jgi:DNA-directed RNA polymerase subunit RPC12/RpoP